MWVMSIIGVVWFSLSLICIFAFADTDIEAAVGWGLLGLAYAVPYAIVGVVTTKKKKETDASSTEELLKLHELKEKNILTEDEFQAKKRAILAK
ncbi:SHOCT domain-containing protein [Aliidiomarina halalkaliphila]|uniref:SHOCT domain-containing protein n=1 Tax=Aliidiomarina halalkaliphila TaxID=2593535 RepID=A0A552X4G6_9GAMM|nr:SHOCT domain-containing protein [Aliidiomarina halalkaliphila]TRW49924.1 SHOCT domain-containing protein [Aliidiomarina halalkaliphila]